MISTGGSDLTLPRMESEKNRPHEIGLRRSTQRTLFPRIVWPRTINFDKFKSTHNSREPLYQLFRILLSSTCSKFLIKRSKIRDSSQNYSWNIVQLLRRQRHLIFFLTIFLRGIPQYLLHNFVCKINLTT